MNQQKVVVIGGGPAAITFTRNLRRLAPQSDVLVFRPEPASMIYCAIPYAMEGLVAADKVYKGDGLVTETGARLLRRKVTEVDFAARQVRDDSGESHAYDKLVIATGAVPIMPPVPGNQADNVFTVKTQSDMERIMGRLENKPRKAVVVGAGAIGIEQAQAYRTLGLEVWLIDSAARVLPHMLDSDMSDPLAAVLRESGIELRLGTTVNRLLDGAGTAVAPGKDGAVARVELSNGESVDLDPATDFVCFAVGMRPDVELFEDTPLSMERDGIVVDSAMRTSLPDVFAIGDVCAFTSLIDGQPLGGKLATNAVPMGKVAARVVAGQAASYAGFVNGAATCVGDWRVGSSGFTAEFAAARGIETVVGYAQVQTAFPIMPGAGPLHARVVADRKDGRVVGAQFAAHTHVTDKVDVVSLAIQQRLTLEELATLSYSSQPWQSHYPAGNAIVDACENALEKL